MRNPFHEGVDYNGRHRIFSRVYGKVVWAPEASYEGYGYYMISHDTNDPTVLYLGGHFESRDVQEGAIVTPVTLLGVSGRLGMPGGTDYDHLHAAIYIVPSGSLKSTANVVGLLRTNYTIKQNFTVNPNNWSIPWNGN